MTPAAASLVPRRRPWPALLALLGLLFVATAAAPLPPWVGDLGRLCSAQGATQPGQPDDADHFECCVACLSGHLAGPPADPASFAAPTSVATELVPGGRRSWGGRAQPPVRARAPPPA